MAGRLGCLVRDNEPPFDQADYSAIFHSESDFEGQMAECSRGYAVSFSSIEVGDGRDRWGYAVRHAVPSFRVVEGDMLGTLKHKMQQIAN